MRSMTSNWRAPTRTACLSGTGRKPGTVAARLAQHLPTAVASAMPSRNPLVVVSGVLKSPWASSQMIAGGGAPSPASVPTQLMQLPASAQGKAPLPATLRTFPESSRATAKEVPTSSAKRSCTSTSSNSSSPTGKFFSALR